MTKVADKRLGAFMRFQHDITERVIKGSLNPDEVEKAIRPLIGQKQKGIKRNLKYLIEVEQNIHISEVAPFETRKYFKQGKNGTTKIWMSERFKSVILDRASAQLSLAPTSLSKHKLGKAMNDSEILNELGNPEPYTIDDALSIIKHLTEGQPKGEAGTMESKDYRANIFYVDVGDRTVAVYVHWGWHRLAECEWFLRCLELDGDDRWDEGRCVFSSAIADA